MTKYKLAKKYNRSERWIREQVHDYVPIVKPRSQKK